MATVIVKRGTLEEGQPLVLGAEWGRVRGLLNAAGQELQAALPGQPVEIFGLHAAPRAGDAFLVVQRCASGVTLSLEFAPCGVLTYSLGAIEGRVETCSWGRQRGPGAPCERSTRAPH